MRGQTSLWLAVVCQALCLCGCSATDENQQAAEEEGRRAKEASLLDEMVRKHNAVKDWRPASRYTLDLQKCLVRSDARPVLCEMCLLADVQRTGDVCTAHFRNFLPRLHHQDRWLIVTCSPEKGEALALSRGVFFWLVVQPRSVDRPVIALKAEAPQTIAEQRAAAEAADLAKATGQATGEQAVPDVTFIRGELLDFMPRTTAEAP